MMTKYPCRRCNHTVKVRSHGQISTECIDYPGDLKEARQRCPQCAVDRLVDAANSRQGKAVQ